MRRRVMTICEVVLTVMGMMGKCRRSCGGRKVEGKLSVCARPQSASGKLANESHPVITASLPGRIPMLPVRIIKLLNSD